MGRALIVGGRPFHRFMMQGVADLVANQESANYGPNYHARSDEFDKLDLRQLRLNAVIAAAVTFGVAQAEVAWIRQSRAEIEALVRTTDLEQQMRNLAVWEGWVNRTRGRSK